MFLRSSLLMSSLFVAFASFGSPQASAEICPGVGCTQLFAVLTGGTQLDANHVAGAGSPTGYGAASIIFSGSTTICYGIEIGGIAGDRPVEAHIHHAVAGQNDPNDPPPVIFQVPQASNPGSVSGCTTASAPILKDIRANPSAYYINVHTARFPGGALRGQLY
jgi:CHRD domain